MSRWGIVDSTLEGRFNLYFPHQHEVPDDYAANRRWRLTVLTEPHWRKRNHILEKCKLDFLYYLKTFGFVFLAKGDPKPVPFLPYGFQVETATVLWKCLHDGQEDLRIKKPRDQGISWLVLWILEHAWHFYPNRHILVGSRKAEEVDGSTSEVSGDGQVGEWSKLLPKIDFMHLNMPKWSLPDGYRPRTRPYRLENRIVNPANGSMFQGESANDNFGAGRRYWAIFFDEFARTDKAQEILGACGASSDCHLWVSTPEGPATTFAMLGRSGIRNINIDWWMNPLCAEGMTVQPETGKRSSPWYEKECQRLGWNPALIANNIDADESQGGGGYYQKQLIDLLLGTPSKPGTVSPPNRFGELDFDSREETGPRPTRWVDQKNGRWKLWLNFDCNGNPPRDDWYIAGVDVAAAPRDEFSRSVSNSVIAVVSALSGAKVAEFVVAGMAPHKLAEVAVAATRWFIGQDGRPAFLIWEANGPGSTFGSVVVEDYGIRSQIYREDSIAGKGRPGFHKGSRAKGESILLFGRHAKMIAEGRYVERSAETVEEMLCYQHDPGGGAPYHAASKDKADPSSSGDNHGDRVIAAALCCLVLQDWRRELVADPSLPAYGSIRHMEYLDRKKKRQAMLI